MVNASSGPSFDWFQGQGFQGSADTTASPPRDFRNEMQLSPVFNTAGKKVPGVTRVTFTINTLSEGLNAYLPTVARQPTVYRPTTALGRLSTSNLDSRVPGTLTLHLLETGEDVPIGNTTPANAALWSINAFGTFAMANGGTANHSLFVEGSSTNPALTAATYTPGAVITSLSKIHIASAGEYVAVGKVAAAVEVLSTLTAAGPTVVGTMNALTASCWGIVESPLNSTTPGAGTLIIYAGTTIYTLGTENAIGTAPTVALTNIPGGGRILGIQTLKGEPARIFFHLPRTSLSASMFSTLGATPARIYSTNLEGTDLQELKTPLANIYYAELWNDGIVISDGPSLMLVDGTNGTKDLGLFTDRVLQLGAATPGVRNSDYITRVGGICNCLGILRVLSVFKNVTTVASTLWAWEEYDPAAGSWSAADVGMGPPAGFTTPAGSATGTRQLGGLYTGGPGQAYSEATGYVHQLRYSSAGQSFAHQYVSPIGWSPYKAFAQTTGAGAATGLPFTPNTNQGAPLTNKAQSAVMVLEGLEGLPFVLESVRSLADIASGGSGTSITYAFASQQGAATLSFSNNLSATFYDTDPIARMFKPFDDNRAYATRLLYQIAITTTGVDASYYKSPNALPFKFSVLVFDSIDQVRSSAEVRASVG